MVTVTVVLLAQTSFYPSSSSSAFELLLTQKENTPSFEEGDDTDSPLGLSNVRSDSRPFFFHLKLILLLAPRAFFVAEKKCFCFATTKVAFAAFFRITPQYLAKQSSFFLTGLHSNRKWPKMSRLENIVSEVSNVYFQNCLCPNNISVVTIFTPFCWVILSSFSIFTPFCWVSFCAVPILPPFIRSVLS